MVASISLKTANALKLLITTSQAENLPLKHYRSDVTLPLVM